MLVSEKQPYCRCCGKKLKKATERHVFGVPEGSSASSFGYFSKPHAEDPNTRAEAQRYLNQQIVSSGRDYRGKMTVATWDGESWRSEREFFCTINCAADYGRFAVTYAPDLRTKHYADAGRAALAQQGSET